MRKPWKAAAESWREHTASFERRAAASRRAREADGEDVEGAEKITRWLFLGIVVIGIVYVLR